MNLFEAIIVAIVEGLTEYLPVSSTGHMIVTSALLGIEKDEFTKLYEVSIQLGAIMAVVVLYWRKFFDFSKWKFYIKLIIAVIPALILGFLFSDQIDALLESPLTVAITLLTGGIIFLFIDRFFQYHEIDKEENISNKKAFIIGIWQCLAMIPGVSRSASSIIGGMQQRLTRKLAAEFSFYLAVPTMAAATGYSVFLKNWKNTAGEAAKGYELILASTQNTIAFVTGNIIAFVVAIIAIKFFIGFLQKHGFVLFGWYRIVAGTILLILIMSGVISN
jgi:undecaprenyl-diphosphatase